MVKRLHYIDNSFVTNIMNHLNTFSTCILRGGIVLLKNPKPSTLADPKRFKTIQDLTKMRPDCGASIDDVLVIDNDYLLIVDLAYVGNILNPYNSPSASYVRNHGVMVTSYTRPESSLVLWSDPFLLLRLSCHLSKSLTTYEEVGKVLGRVSCSSGTFLIVPIRKDMPESLGSLMNEALAKKTGVQIKIPKGTYRVFYEQFDVPEGAKKELYQNIAIQKQ